MTMSMARPTTYDGDRTSRRRLRFGVVTADGLWTEAPGDLVRIRAVDLRDLAHKTAAIREDAPHVDVVVDIDVMIAADARSARAAMASAGCQGSGTLLYVGTPAGLSGLIADIHAVGIADGAVLVPFDSNGVADLIRDAVLPELRMLASA